MTTDQETTTGAGVTTEGNAQTVRIGQVVAATWNARRTMDENGVRELAASIEAEGLLQPLVVRRIGGEILEVICGARRLAALQMLHAQSVRVWIVEVTDAQAKVMNLAENIQRASLLPMEEAEAFAGLLRDGITASEIAVQIGKASDPSYVYQRLRLMKLTPKMRAALVAGTISLGVALQVARLPEGPQKEIGGILLQGGGRNEYGVRWVREWVERNAMRALTEAPWDLSDGALPGGACAVCPKRTGHAPELFPDLASGKKQATDRCLDAACWKKRTAVLIGIVKQANPGIPELMGYHEGYKWKVIEAATGDDVLRGVIVEDGFGDPKRTAGSQVAIEWIGKNQVASGMAEVARKRERVKRQRAEKVRAQILVEVVPQICKSEVTSKDWEWGVKTLIGRLVNDDRRNFCKVFHLDAEKTTQGGRDFEAAIFTALKGTIGGDLRACLILAAICDASKYHAMGKADHLLRLAERYKIRVNEIEASVLEGTKKPIAKTGGKTGRTTHAKGTAKPTRTTAKKG